MIGVGFKAAAGGVSSRMCSTKRSVRVSNVDPPSPAVAAAGAAVGQQWASVALRNRDEVLGRDLEDLLDPASWCGSASGVAASSLRYIWFHHE